MGLIFSSPTANQDTTPNNELASESETMENQSELNETSNNDISEEQFHDTMSDDEETRAKLKEEEMIAFHKQLHIKREQRREIMAKHRSDKKMLENALEDERKTKLNLYEQNKYLRDILKQNNIEVPENLTENVENSMFKEALSQLTQEIEKQKNNNNKLRCDLASSNSALQAAYSDMADLSAQNSESMKQIYALKEVVTISKTLISLREDQLTELKNKLTEIEQSLADREANMLSTDLRQEYERQLQNIRTLRGLYEERARLAEVTRQALVRELNEHKALYETASSRCTELTSEINELKAKETILEETIAEKNNEISTYKEEINSMKSEMLVINKVLLGYKTKGDLDKLVQRLEENHGILTHMAGNENDSEASSALPKLLLELVNQVDDDNSEANEITNQLMSTNDQLGVETQRSNNAEEIVQNLPKVWKVLMELLSHQSESNTNVSEKVTTCYKSVETKSGPVLVPSVSQTYIRLKDLIIEKLSLVKEVNRMKQLNTHLETRLQEQERRLCLVTTELSKTWHVVGRLRKHHQQLHTHEKILKYELQQKRKLLNELKEELEFCREKWEQAREKNTQSEKDWKKLRAEFSSRKLKDSTALNNSAESGYSDERPSDESSESNDESEYILESNLKSRMNLKKSFEVTVDSSVDLNLIAEREDPVSDMIDVADLSLDTQDEAHETFDDSYDNENLLKTDRVSETEDEAAEIGHDSCHEDLSISESVSNSCEIEDINMDVKIFPFDNIQNSPTADLTECGHSSQCQITSKPIEVENKLNKSDMKLQDQKEENESNVVFQGNTKDSELRNEHENTESDKPRELVQHDFKNLTESKETKSTLLENTTNKVVEETDDSEDKFKIILANIKKQDERLKIKDRKLDELEYKCSEVVTNLTNTVSTGKILEEKLTTLQEKYTNKNKTEISFNNNGEGHSKDSDSGPSVSSKEFSLKICQSEEDNIREHDEDHKTYDETPANFENNSSGLIATIKTDMKSSDGVLQQLDAVHENCVDITDTEGNSNDQNKLKLQTEASSSSEIDHEARFAARDLRLKRLEEQTKSLVNKVNSTTTKGVKIHYKLEELHNIYGSDHSRSETPSEDTGENLQSNDDDKENENN